MYTICALIQTSGKLILYSHHLCTFSRRFADSNLAPLCGILSQGHRRFRTILQVPGRWLSGEITGSGHGLQRQDLSEGTEGGHGARSGYLGAFDGESFAVYP